MHRLLARKKSTGSLYRTRSEASFTASATPSDQRLAEENSAPYKNPNYEILLETQGGSYMKEYELGITDASESLCQILLEKAQVTPKDTIFRDDIFRTTCDKLRGKNEARIFKDSTPLIVPYAETRHFRRQALSDICWVRPHSFNLSLSLSFLKLFSFIF